MIWVVYPLFVAFMWAIIDIIDKHVIDGELKDPLVCVTIFGFVAFFLFSVISNFYGNIFSLPEASILILILAGAIYSIALVFYYSSFQKERMSLLVPLFPLKALFVTLFSFFILNEILSTMQYIGIVILVVGAVLITYKKGVKYKISFAIILTLSSVFFRAIRDVFVKFVSGLGNYSIFDILFWVFLGCFIVSTITFILHHPHIIKKSKRGIEHIILNYIFTSINLGVYFYAISIYPVSLVVSVACMTPLIVFILVLLFTKLKPKIICEKFDRVNLMINLIATILVVIGTVLIVL